MNYTAKFQTTPPPQPELFRLYEEEPGGRRPPCLGEPRGPQEKVQQCTVEQLADVAPMVQILDTSGLRDGIRWWRCCGCSTCRLSSRSIAVPKISLDRVPQRSALPVSQTAEQLVEVPTNPGVHARGGRLKALFEARDSSYSLRTGSTASGFGQIVDNPVSQGRGGGLQGSRAGQNSKAYLEQIVEIPVPQGRRGSGGGLQGSLPVQNSAAVAEQIVDIPARRSLSDFLQGQGSSSSSSSRLRDDADEALTEVFRTFHRSKKKREVGLALGVGTAPRVEPIHAASL